MAVKMRLRRMGQKKAPFYRIIIADERSPRDGRFIAEIGLYDPTKEPSLIKFDEEEAKKRIKKIDRERREYHKYYTGEDWMKVDNYDLMINASRIDYREMEVLMRNYLEMKGYLK